MLPVGVCRIGQCALHAKCMPHAKTRILPGATGGGAGGEEQDDHDTKGVRKVASQQMQLRQMTPADSPARQLFIDTHLELIGLVVEEF